MSAFRFAPAALVLAAALLVPANAHAQSWTENYRRSQSVEPPQAYAGARRPLDGSLKDTGYASPALAPSRRPDIWTGLYIGIEGGGGFGGTTFTGLGDGDATTIGGVFGGHVGYNIQLGAVVTGLEVDGGWAGIDGGHSTNGIQATSKLGWLSSTRGRIGYAFDNWLVYATGGLAFAGLEASATGAGATATASDTLVGYAVGGGIEMKLSEQFSARLEALHYGFGDTTVALPQGALKVDADVTTVRAGVSFHWN